VTSTSEDAEALELLRLFGFPFQRDESEAAA